MSKEKFLLVSLNESKTKELAQAVTNDTCRKILDHLADNEATESHLSHSLKLPISTVHYNLQILVKAGLVITDEYHYSEKGKEVNHYKLANKYIIIAPKSTWGLKEKLKSVLPVAMIAGAVGFALRIMSLATGTFSTTDIASKTVPVWTERTFEVSQPVVESVAKSTASNTLGAVPLSHVPEQAVADEVVSTITQNVSENVTYVTKIITQHSIPTWASPALWFLIGAGSAIILYLLVDWIRNRK